MQRGGHETGLAQHAQLGQAAVGVGGPVEARRTVEQHLGTEQGLAADRDLGGSVERPGRPCARPDRGGVPEVFGDDLDRVVGLADRGDDAVGGPQVQPGATQRRHRLDQRLADEGVREPHRAGHVSRELEQPREQCGLEVVEAVVERPVGHGGQQLDVGLATEYRDDLQQGPGGGGQPCDTMLQDVSHPTGHRGALHRRDVELAVVGDHARQFGRVERVAFGPLVHHGHNLAGDVGVGGLGEQLARLLERQNCAARSGGCPADGSSGPGPRQRRRLGRPRARARSARRAPAHGRYGDRRHPAGRVSPGRPTGGPRSRPRDRPSRPR